MATQLLAQGKAVCIFPEGQINRKLGCLKPGVAILASMTGAPIVPVGLSGTHGVMPVEGRLRPYPVSLAAGSAIRVPRVRSNWVPEEEIQRTNHRLFQALRGLIRQAETLRVTPAEQILESGEKISCYGMAY